MASPARIVSIVVLVMLACIVAWLSWDTEAAPPVATPEVEAGDPSADVVEQQSDVDREPDARAVVGSSEEPTSDVTLTFVIIGPDGEPRPNARVGHHAQDPEGESLRMLDREKIAWDGSTLLADVHGEVRIDRSTGYSLAVFARDGEDWGQLYVAASNTELRHRIEIERDLTLRARVLDAGGNPAAGVPVKFTDDIYASRGIGPGPTVRTSDPDGIAVFEHAHVSVQKSWGEDAVLRIECLMKESVFGKIDLANPPVEPVELRIPVTGSMRFTLVDAGGQRVRNLLEEVYGTCFLMRDTGEVSRWMRFDDGVLEVTRIGLGLELRLELDSAAVSGRVECVGPTIPGQRVDVDVPVEVRPTISGRLVDREGLPQKGYWFATLMHGGRGWYNHYFETAEDGMFHTPVPELPYRTVGKRVIWFHRTLPDDEHQSFLDLEALELRPGRNELGDVVLVAPPLLVEGSVVRSNGEGVADAKLSVARGDPGGEIYYLPKAGDDHGVAGADGAFEIRAFYEGPKLLLQAVDGAVRGPFVSFEPGAVVRYELPSVGAIEIPVTFAEGIGPDDVLYELTDRSTGLYKRRAALYVFDDGVVRWKGVPIGEYDVGARMVGAPEVLFSRTGVRVDAGETTRLESVQLGSDVRPVRLRVVSASGEPVDKASVVVAPDRDPGTPRTARQTALGDIELYTSATPIDVLVLAPGFRSLRTRVVDGATVQLQPGLEIELRVTLPDGFPAEGQALVPQLRRFDPSDPDPQPWQSGHSTWMRGAGKMYYSNRHAWLWRQMRRLSGSDSVKMRVPAPGDYAVEWLIDGPDERELGAAGRRVFSVSEATERTVVEIELSAEELR